MMKKSILFISCEEAHHICDKSQYGEATIWERIKLNIRLSWCKVSRAYTKRNRKLTKALEVSDTNVLDNNEKDKLQKAFEAELKKQH